MKTFIKKSVLLLAAIMLVTSAMEAQNNSAPALPSLAPTSSSVSLKTVRALFPNVPTAVANELFGGLHSVTSIAVLNGGDQTSLNNAELQTGMLVYVADVNMYFRYKGTDLDAAVVTYNAADDADEVVLGEFGEDTHYWESLSSLIYNSIKEITTVDATGDILTPSELTNGQISQANLVANGTGVPTSPSNGDHFVVQDAKGNPLQSFVYNDGTWTLISSSDQVNIINNDGPGGNTDYVVDGGEIFVDANGDGIHDAGETTNIEGDYKEGDLIILDGNTFVYDGDKWTQINSNVVDTDNQNLQNFSFNSTTNVLSIDIEDGTGVNVDLSDLMDNTDEQDLTGAVLNPATNVLTISIENGASTTVDLSSLLNPDNNAILYTDANITYAAGSITDADGNTGEDFASVTYIEGDIVKLADGNTYVLNSASQWMQISKDDYKESVEDRSSGTQAVDPSNGLLYTDATFGSAVDVSANVEGNIIKLADGHSYAYDGTKWIQISKNASVTEGAGGPTINNNTQEGDVYTNTTTGDTYIFDGTTWNKINNDAYVEDLRDLSGSDATVTAGVYNAGTSGPALTPVVGNIIKLADGHSYGYTGTAWVQLSKNASVENHTGAGDNYFVDSNGNLFDDADGNEILGAETVLNNTYQEGDVVIITNNAGDEISYILDENGDFIEINSTLDADKVDVIATGVSVLLSPDNGTHTSPVTNTDYQEGDVVKLTNGSDYATWVLDNGSWVLVSQFITDAAATTYDVYHTSVTSGNELSDDAVNMDDSRSDLSGVVVAASGGVVTILYPAIWGDYTYAIDLDGNAATLGDQFEITNGITTTTVAGQDSDANNSSTSDAGSITYKQVVIAAGTYSIVVR